MTTVKGQLQTFARYRSLLVHLIERDFKVKYRRSVLGILWSLLSPLLMMIVLTLVFSELFRFEIENYAAYVLSGQLIFNFFSECTSTAMSSMIGSANLIHKVYVPKYIFPLEKAMFAFVNLLISCIALIGVVLVTGVPFTLNMLYFPVTFILIFIFGLGVGLILASLAVFFRDVMHFYGVFITALTYLTPVFYPAKDVLSETQMFYMNFNPMYWYVSMFRNAILYDLPPSVDQIIVCSLVALVSLFIGLVVFKKSQDKFIFYI